MPRKPYGCESRPPVVRIIYLHKSRHSLRFKQRHHEVFSLLRRILTGIGYLALGSGIAVVFAGVYVAAVYAAPDIDLWLDRAVEWLYAQPQPASVPVAQGQAEGAAPVNFPAATDTQEAFSLPETLFGLFEAAAETPTETRSESQTETPTPTPEAPSGTPQGQAVAQATATNVPATAKSPTATTVNNSNPSFPTATNTPVPPSATPSRTPTRTNTPTSPPAAATNSPSPTRTPTSAQSATPTAANGNTTSTSTPILPSATPTRTPTATPQACGFSTHGSYENELLALINEAREDSGLPALVHDARLRAAARGHSADMACNNFVSHTGSDGSSSYDRITAQGYYPSWWGENIYKGWNTSAQQAMNWWMNSAPHRANILNPNYVHIGVGHALVGTQNAYTLNFGRP
jgi:uncharacterized protein YkwD